MEVSVVSATRGERGWRGDPAADPGLEAFGKLREAELLCAAQILGVREVHFLNYIDGDLDPVAHGYAHVLFRAEPVIARGTVIFHRCALAREGEVKGTLAHHFSTVAEARPASAAYLPCAIGLANMRALC